MPLSDIDYLKHIRDEAKFINQESRHLDFEDFVNNETLKRAFVRSIEIIGEASKKVSTGFKEKYPALDWRSMAAMRDKLIHDYFGIDYEIVWDVIKNEIPKLLKEINRIIGRVKT